MFVTESSVEHLYGLADLTLNHSTVIGGEKGDLLWFSKFQGEAGAPWCVGVTPWWGDILASAESFVVDHKSGFHLGCKKATLRTNGVDIGPPDTEFLFHIGVRLVWIEQVFILKTVRFIEKVIAEEIVK